MSATFTPGAWIVKTDADGWPYIEVAKMRKITVEGTSFEEVIHNAALIAAAPDLLAACEELLASAIQGDMSQAWCPSVSLLRRAEAAIAKARGKA